MSKTENATPFQVRLTPGTPEKLDFLAKKYGLNKSSVVNMLINKDYNTYDSEAIEDAIWALKIQLAEKDGYLSTEESENYIKSVLNAKD